MATDSDPQLLPDGPDVEEGLAPPPDVTDLPTVTVADSPPPPLGRSWAFDFNRDQFVRSNGAVLQTFGTLTLLGWIDKCLHTRRGALPIHPDGYGLEDPDGVFGRPVRELSADDLEAQFRDALTFHPRIADVTGMRLDVDPQSTSAYAVYTVVTDPPTEDAELRSIRTDLQAV